jgi:subtilisin family serine protease
VPRRLIAVIALTVVALCGAIPLVDARATPPTAPDAVLAVIDSGINPYHETFRDNSPRAYQHPSTYIPGFPADAEALHLTFGADYWDSVAADCEGVWNKVLDEKLYWIPGTRIVGAITFAAPGVLDCDLNKPAASGVILDADGHGTMTASRAASKEYGACPTCLVVAVQSPMIADPGSIREIAAIQWAAANASWIDAQSNSWGPIAPAWEPTGAAGLYTANPELVRAVETSSAAHLGFWASGNGALFRWGLVGHPTLGATNLTPSAIIVGGHDSGYMNTWPGFSAHVVSDSCAAWAAPNDHASRMGDRISSGTSGATPFAAGVALDELRTARQILGSTGTGVEQNVVARGPAGLVPDGPLVDGVFTLDEWKRLVLSTATPRPERQREDGPPCGPLAAPYNETPIRWVDVPPQYPEFLQIGYGATDGPAKRLAGEVLRGTAPAPDRSATDLYFSVDHEARRTTYEVFSKP